MRKSKLLLIQCIGILLFISFQNFGYVNLGRLHAETKLNDKQEKKNFTLSRSQSEALAYQQKVLKEQEYVYAESYLRKKLENSPLYQNLQFEENSPSPCLKSDTEYQNHDCKSLAETQNSPDDENTKLNFKIKPLRSIANINYQGDIDANLNFELLQNNVNIKFSKNLNKKEQIFLEHDSKDSTTKLNYGISF